MVFLCLSIVTYTIDNQRQEAKAIAPAILAAGLVVGAVALGGGVYFTHKEDLETVTKDCMDWLSSSVPDAYKDLTNLVANGGKYAVSAIAQKGILSYLKHKFGWGDSSEPIRNVTIPITEGIRVFKYFDGYYDSVWSHDNSGFTNGVSYYNYFKNLVDSGTYDVFYTVSYLDEKIYEFKPYAIPKGVTDVYYYYEGGTKYIVFVCAGKEYTYEWLKEKIGLSMSFEWDSWDSKKIERIDYIQSWAPAYYSLFWETVNDSGLPVGTRVWETKESYENKITSKLVTVGKSTSYEAPVDIGSNANLQTEDTAISVPTIGNMTLEQFIEATGDLAQDDTPAWEQVLEQLGALTGGGENEGDNDDDNENNGAVGGDFIIPGLGITWFESLLESVKSIPKSITDKISDTVLKFQFAYEDFKDWLADLIKSIPKSFKSLFTTVTDAITDIPGSISGYFTDVVEAVQAIDIPAFPSLDDIKNGLLAIPGYIQALPSQFRDWFEQIIAGIQVIPISISGYFADVVDAIEAIDFPAFPSLEAITEGVLAIPDYIQAIPGQFSDWFESVIDAIKAIPGEFTSLIDRIIEAIQALPGAFSKWLDWSGIIEAINALADIVGNIFIIDGAMIYAAYLDLADAVSTHWNIFDQIKKLCDVAVTESKIEYPVIYMQVPSFLKPVLQNNKNYVKGTHQAYNPEKGMLVMDLSNYKELFQWCRRISGGFIWFLLFRWIMRKFDIQIILSS